MIPPCEFVVAQPGTSDTIHFYHGAYLGQYSDATYRYYFAPVALPQGVRITSVVVFYEDEHVTTNFRVQMWRKNMYTALGQSMCQWTSSSSTPGVKNHKISPISYGIVNNGGYTYYLIVNFTASSNQDDIQIHGIRINYK
jgi:hypothetical protein